MSNPGVMIIDILFQIQQGEGNLKVHLRNDKVKSHPKRSLIQASCYGICRYYFQLQWILLKLVEKKPKKQKLCLVIMFGLFQLRFSTRPQHAVVKSSVDLLTALKLAWAKGLVNGVLRNYLRHQQELETQLSQEDEACLSHPQWLIYQLKQAWPQQYRNICEQNNVHPPLSLRVNQHRIKRDAYERLLHEQSLDFYFDQERVISLSKPCAVEDIPGFSEGLVSVQDSSAQRAARLIELQPNLRVLDACAAPGGKTAHMLEIQPDIDLVAVDIDSSRLAKVAQNLQRLQLAANLICADASNVDTWWDGNYFDRILLDAPCSATGVIRRQPDVKLLLKEQDIQRLSDIQANLLSKLWPLLKPGGKLLYATCSVMPCENEQQIKHFMSQNSDAFCYSLNNVNASYGLQLLPQQGDGFYYALLGKKHD